MQSRKAGFPCATRARKREPCLQRYVSRDENDSDRKFSKSIFFQSFSGNHFSPRFLVPCSLLAENIFSVFRSLHLPLDTLIKKSSYRWTNQKVQLQLVLQRGSLPSEIALQGGNIESKMVYRGVSADFEKPKNIFG